MTKEKKILKYKVRLDKIKSRDEWYKTPGVAKKLERQIRNCEK